MGEISAANLPDDFKIDDDTKNAAALIQMIVNDYVPKSDLKALVERWKVKRDDLWKDEIQYRRDRGNGYDECLCDVEELLERCE